jgi:hypothetical protein
MRFMDIRIKSDFLFIRQLISFYNEGGACLLRGTNFIFIYNSTSTHSLDGQREFFAKFITSVVDGL